MMHLQRYFGAFMNLLMHGVLFAGPLSNLCSVPSLAASQQEGLLFEAMGKRHHHLPSPAALQHCEAPDRPLKMDC